MSSTGDGETSPAEWLLLGALFLFGLVFLLKPAVVTTGTFIDFVDAFPDPSQLGPYGSLVAAVSMLFGGGGLLRNKLR